MSEPLHKLTIQSENIHDLITFKELADRIGLKTKIKAVQKVGKNKGNWNFDVPKVLEHLGIDENAASEIEEYKKQESKLHLIRCIRRLNTVGYGLKECKLYVEGLLTK